MLANRTDNTVKSAKKSSFGAETLSVVLLVLTVAVASFFTYSGYYALLAKKESLVAAKAVLETRKNEFLALERLKIQSEVPAFREEIARYASEYREDTVLSSLFEETSGVLPLSISMSKGEKLPNGLSLASVSVTLRANDQTALLKYLSHLTGTKGKKRYLVKTVNFPFANSGKDDPFQVTLNMGMYHYSR